MASRHIEMALARMGYDIRHKDYECDHGKMDFIAIDEDGCLCFIEADETDWHDDYKAYKPDEDERKNLERIATCFFNEHDEPALLDRQVVFCKAELKIIGDNRGFFRIAKCI